MLPAATKLYGKLSARSKLEALALIILLSACVLTYRRGLHNGEAHNKITQVERERRQNADTIKKKTANLDKVKAASDSAHVASTTANARADSFRLRPIPIKPNLPVVLQTPANGGAPVVDLKPLVTELYAVIANRDSALVLERAANTALKRENALLLVERDTARSLVKSLNRQIALDVAEIATWKKIKTPRFGVKAGILIGAVTALAVDTGIDRLKKKGVDSN
jgi:hypothetical protein